MELRPTDYNIPDTRVVSKLKVIDIFRQQLPNHGQNMLLKETPTFNQTREDPISKNHNLKGNESKLRYFYSKIMNLDKQEQITFVPRNLIIFTH